MLEPELLLNILVFYLFLLSVKDQGGQQQWGRDVLLEQSAVQTVIENRSFHSQSDSLHYWLSVSVSRNILAVMPFNLPSLLWSPFVRNMKSVLKLVGSWEKCLAALFLSRGKRETYVVLSCSYLPFYVLVEITARMSTAYNFSVKVSVFQGIRETLKKKERRRQRGSLQILTWTSLLFVYLYSE